LRGGVLDGYAAGGGGGVVGGVGDVPGWWGGELEWVGERVEEKGLEGVSGGVAVRVSIGY